MAGLVEQNTTAGVSVPDTMWAVVTTGNGGFDKLDYRRVPTPKAGPGEVLIQILAAGANNTEINTRLGWYSKTVEKDTEGLAATEEESPTHKEDGGWNQKTPFPLVQGTDCCGRVVRAFDAAGGSLVGKRVLVRSCMRGAEGFASMENIWMASDFNGAFAQFVKVRATEVFAVECDWSDVELGSIPCAYGTAETMVHRAGVKAGEHVLVPGASGGVGSATVQLAKRRGAKVTAICGRDKMQRLREIGADVVIGGRFGQPGWPSIMADIKHSVDVVIDNVGGDGFPSMIDALKRGGRYATSGAISGPLVALDLRTLYLRDLTLIGCTAWDEPVFGNLVRYIERGEIKPLVVEAFPLEQIAAQQRAFLEKQHVGKFVLIPPPVEA